MPDLQFEPVDHDPFTALAQYVPIDHDPWASSMTHWPEAPNPVPGIVQSARDFLKGGLSEVLKGQGVQLPEWSNRVGGVLQSEAANTAIGMTLPLKGAKGITAFHGSPYDFDRFDLSKIGTGEGAQAYGHGLYFAEAPETAATYKEARNLYPEENRALKYLETFKGDRVAAAKRLRDYAEEMSNKPDTAWSIRRSAELLEKGHELKPQGKMYQVSIKADPEHFLDWDKPLSEQSDKVKEVLGNLTGRKTSGAGSLRSGQWWHDEVASKVGGDAVSTTNALRQAGISGIKYLDQGSRDLGLRVMDESAMKAGPANGPHGPFHVYQRNSNQHLAGPFETEAEARAWKAKEEQKAQTRNYVVFDDKLVDIMKKYGIAGIGALPAAGAYHFKTQQTDHDPFAQ
jgi:hypothetical protein